MKASIVRIGNSRGIRLPKSILEQCELQDEVELEPRRGCLIIRPVRHARTGWEEAFARMAATGDDRLLAEDRWPASAWDESEWEW